METKCQTVDDRCSVHLQKAEEMIKNMEQMLSDSESDLDSDCDQETPQTKPDQNMCYPTDASRQSSLNEKLDVSRGCQQNKNKTINLIASSQCLSSTTTFDHQLWRSTNEFMKSLKESSKVNSMT